MMQNGTFSLIRENLDLILIKQLPKPLVAITGAGKQPWMQINMIIVEYKNQQYKVGKIHLQARPYQSGRFDIHPLDDHDNELGMAVWSHDVKRVARTARMNGDFCKAHDIELLHSHMAGIE